MAGAAEPVWRLFLDAPCPAPLARRLAALQADLGAQTWELAPVDAEEFHLSIHFLGATPARLLEDLRKDLAALSHARRPFELACSGLGCFPDESAPRVVWAGILDPAGRYAELFEASRRALNAYRLFKLRRDPAPHLTLARVRRLSAAWDGALLGALGGSARDLGPYPVERLRLRRSLGASAGGAPAYQTLAEFRLGGEA